MLTKIISFVNLIGLLASGFFINKLNNDNQFGATATIPSVVALFETSLASSISSTASTMTLASGTDKEGNSLSGTYGFIIDEGSANEEFVMCSASGTALTGCTRGLSVSAPASSSAALKETHRRGASVKMTEYPVIGVHSRLLNGTDSFPNILTYGSPPTFTASTSIVTKKYVDDIAILGAANATLTLQGLSELATVAEINAGTGLGGTGARLFVNPSYLASSSYGLYLPSSGQKDALAGSSGTPSTTNKYITMNDVASASFSDAADKIIRSDGDSVPSALWLDITKFNITASATGDLIYRNASSFTRLGIGTSGKFLVASASGLPAWEGGDDLIDAGTMTFTGTANTGASLSFAPSSIDINAFCSSTNAEGGEIRAIYLVKNSTTVWAGNSNEAPTAGTSTAMCAETSGSVYWNFDISISADKDSVYVNATETGSSANMTLLWKSKK